MILRQVRSSCRSRCWLGLLALIASLGLAPALPAQTESADGQVVKAVLQADEQGPNRLVADAWGPYEDGFEAGPDGVFACDNGPSASARRGVTQRIELNQNQPLPIVATAWSRAENVSGGADSNYALYLDLVYDDGTPVYGRAGSFATGTHDWQQARVVFIPERPIRAVSFYLLFRDHAGTAVFRDPRLHVVESSSGAMFDGVPVLHQPNAAREGFQIRDVAANSDYVRLEKQALGLSLESREQLEPDGSRSFDVTLRDTTGHDRAITLLYALPVPAEGAQWLDNPRRSTPVEPTREYVQASRWTFAVGANGRLSPYPFGAVVPAANRPGTALGIDLAHPAFYRVGYNAATEELFLAFDLGLTPEKPEARLVFRHFTFDPAWGFRSALDTYYRLFPDAFQRRIDRQGLWMPFARISRVEGWQDFGFRFKEGHDETPWDDAHDILTFRYTEPLTWWMSMPLDMPRTLEAAEAEARRLAADGNPQAKAWLSSAYHDQHGRPVAQFLDTPWSNGAVWSMNSTPGIAPDDHFTTHWNPRLIDSLYDNPKPDAGILDGEYIDSSEGYVTAELDFRRELFAASEAPLTFALADQRPGMFRGTIAFEYIRGIERDVHRRGKLMMANATPDRLPWLAPLLDVLGTETNWNYQGRWQPMSDADLLMRRALCKGKPFCFLMNTDFDQLSPDKVERYMKRAVAYGMFPGFFSPDASTGAYFTRPELYNRDRPLFQKYVPLCRLVAEAGWEPITHARSDSETVYVERFGDRLLTVYNDSDSPRDATITLDDPRSGTGRDHLANRDLTFTNGQLALKLPPEGLAVIELP